MPDGHAPDDEPLRDPEDQLRRDDPDLARRMSAPAAGWVTRRLVLPAVMIAAGFAVLILGYGPLGIGAVLIALVLLFIGGYDLTMRVLQLWRIRRAGI